MGMLSNQKLMLIFIVIYIFRIKNITFNDSNLESNKCNFIQK